MKTFQSLSFYLILVALSSCSGPPEGGEPTVEAEEKAVTFAGGEFDPALVEEEGGSEPTFAKTLSTVVEEEGETEGVETAKDSLADQIREMPDGEIKNLALVELFERWAEADLEAAMAYGESLSDDPAAQAAYYRGVMPKLAQSDPGAVLDIIEDGASWEGQAKAEKMAMYMVSRDDLDRAAKHFATAAEESQDPRMAYMLTARMSRDKSPEEAQAFADSLENEQSKGIATRANVSRLAEKDAFAASKYVGEIEDPYLQSQAIKGLVDNIHRTNPEETVAWAAAIQDEAVRKETMTFLAQRWDDEEDAASLQALLDDPGITDADREAIENAPEGGRGRRGGPPFGFGGDRRR